MASSRRGTYPSDPTIVNCVDAFHNGQAFSRGRGLVLVAGTPYAFFGPYVTNFGIVYGAIQEIAGDSNHLYMIVGQGSADIQAAALGVNPFPTAIARGQAFARSLALDATNVYWSTNCGSTASRNSARQ
jgi:hypothetical protein